MGLKPIARRVWARRGQRPTASSRTRYEWLYAYGFVHPATGRNVQFLLPTANADWMSLALKEFVAAVDPTAAKILMLVVDNAGWHLAKGLEIPANVVLHRLPAYTPELQPTEPLWPLLREALANRDFKDMAGMMETLVDRCRWLMEHPEIVRGAVGFQWARAV